MTHLPHSSSIEGDAQHQLSNLQALMVQSMLIARCDDEAAIVRMAATAAQEITRCSLEAVCVRKDGAHGPLVTIRGPEGPIAFQAVGRVELSGYAWGRAYPLPGPAGVLGYIVVGADEEPSTYDQFLLRLLAHQTVSALAAAHAIRWQLSVNTHLHRAIEDLESRTETMRVLADAAVPGADGAYVVRALTSLTGFPVTVLGQFGHRLSWAAADETEPPMLSKQRVSQLASKSRYTSEPIRSGNDWVVAARLGGAVLGLLVLHDAYVDATEEDLFALRHAATALSAELQQVRMLAEAELNSRRELADDLLAGAFRDTAVARGAALGHDLNVAQQVVAVGWDRKPNGRLLRRLLDTMATKLGVTFLVAQRTQMTVIISPVSEGWVEAHQAVQAGTDIGKTQISLGVGSPCEHLQQIPRSYIEATQALAVRTNFANTAGVTTFADLGFFRVLAGASTTRDLQTFVGDWLGPLLAYDSQHGSQLVATLSAFLESGGHYDQTASTMMIHRSTLRYRLKRIRALTGMNLGNVDTRFNLQVATRAWRLQASL